MSKLKKINEQYKEDIAAIQKSIQELYNKIEFANQIINEATEKAADCVKNGDIDGYHQAQEDLKLQHDAISLYRQKIDAKKKEPLITNAEYERLNAEIIAELTEETAKAKAEVIQLIDQMKPAYERLIELYNLGNETMIMLKRDALKDPTAQNPSSSYYAFRRWNDRSVIEYIDAQLNCYFKTGQTTRQNNSLFI